MPDFTVIAGGNEPHDYEADAAQDAFERLIVEILRAVAREDDNVRPVVDALLKFVEHVRASQRALAVIIRDAIATLRETAFAETDSLTFDTQVERVVRHSLRVAAESMAQDAAAAARRSSRLSELRQAIEAFMIGQEELVRKNGNRSYLADLAVRHLGKWNPKKQKRGTSRSDIDL